MSHGITNADNVFAVRQETWHGLETLLSDYPTREEAQKMVHDWEPISEPIYRREIVVGEDGVPHEEYVAVEGHVLNVRSDTRKPLGVVSDTFVTISNNEMWDIAETLQGEGVEVRYETGGSLFGGKKVWILLRLNEPLVVPGDPNGATIPYYALQNAHDGSGSFRGQALMTRIVCANTSQMADIEAARQGTEFTFKHTKNVRERVEEARAALQGWREGIKEWNRFQIHLSDMKVTPKQRQIFLERFIPAPPPHVASDRVMNNVEEARQLIRDILAGPTCEGIDDTAYGLVQASVEYLNHHRKARSAESRFKRAYLDRSVLVEDATTIAQEVVLI